MDLNVFHDSEVFVPHKPLLCTVVAVLAAHLSSNLKVIHCFNLRSEENQKKINYGKSNYGL